MVRAGLRCFERYRHRGEQQERLVGRCGRSDVLVAFLVASLVVLGLTGCDDAPPAPPPRPDAGPDGPCGPGEPSVEAGLDRPFVANPDRVYRIGAGLQGGHHIDVSLRVRGQVDADHADIELRLFDQLEGGHLLGSHLNDDVLLTLNPEGWCEYPIARMVLIDEEGGLLPRERVLELPGRQVRLEVGVRSDPGTARLSEVLTLLPPE